MAGGKDIINQFDPQPIDLIGRVFIDFCERASEGSVQARRNAPRMPCSGDR
ncbi:MAG: hypothetical protein LBR79_06565 [Oscillospiraceae bacterium]|nr:hypothetical protein [Oscillospiraceae bacterium]